MLPLVLAADFLSLLAEPAAANMPIRVARFLELIESDIVFAVVECAELPVLNCFKELLC